MARGLALNRPGTSVQISRREAASLAAKYELEVSEPPRPRSTVSPASLAAMNPCVMMTPSSACHAAISARSGAKSHVADRKLAFKLEPARCSARSTVRASIQRVAMPCALRKAQPSAVARSSPIAMTRARRRSSIWRLPAISAVRLSSSARNASNTRPARHASACARSRCAPLDALEPRPVSAACGRREKRLEAIGDA